MPVIRIDDGGDPRVADYGGVAEPARLRERGLLIAEGRFVVRRVFDSPRVRIRSLLLSEAALGALDDLVERTAPDLPVYVASSPVITAATGFRMQRGCLALAERLEAEPAVRLIETSRFLVVLERVVDADNIGALFRGAEAFGVDAVLLSPGCCDPFYRKAIRTSSGAVALVPWREVTDWTDTLDMLREQGFVTIATTPDRTATGIGAFVQSNAVDGKVAVLFGTEGHGLTDETLARADVRIRIPMTDALDSLNVAMAAGIVLHRLHEARSGPPTGA